VAGAAAASAASLAAPEAAAGHTVFSEGGANTFDARIDQVKTGDAPIFLGEFGASRSAAGANDYYAARISACEREASESRRRISEVDSRPIRIGRDTSGKCLP
jgi:hypothetical protein